MAEIIQTAHAYDIDLCAKMKTAAKIKIGGEEASKTGKFLPNINMSKWNNEYYLNMNLPITITSEVETFDGMKVALKTKDFTLIYYPLNNNDLEYEIVYDKKPKDSVIVFDLVYSDEFDFFYQPALVQKQIDFGYERPPNVDGSYAVYCRKAYNKYCSGKFCHFYYPYLKDADGKMTRVDEFEIIAGKMVIVLPEIWLGSARYPVTLGPTIGYSTAGASSYGNNIVINGTSYISEASTDIVTTLHFAVAAVDASNKGVKVAIYNCNQADKTVNNKTRIDYGIVATATVSDDNSVAAVVGGTIAGSTYYWLGTIVENSNTKIKCDTTGAVSYDNWPTTYAAEPQDPWTNSGNLGTSKFTVWADYGGATSEIAIPIFTSHYNRRRRE
jgi:hypothetical protein